eukprot:11598095-Alexandrium_andersonii.AAC.1
MFLLLAPSRAAGLLVETHLRQAVGPAGQPRRARYDPQAAGAGGARGRRNGPRWPPPELLSRVLEGAGLSEL